MEWPTHSNVVHGSSKMRTNNGSLDLETNEGKSEKRLIRVMGGKAELERIQERMEGKGIGVNGYRQLFYIL